MVWALLPGEVSLAETREKEGVFTQIVSKMKGVVFKHNYFHNASNFHSKGDTICENCVIALAGSTGRSTAKHIHLEIYTEDCGRAFVKELKENVKHYYKKDWGRVYFDPVSFYKYIKEKKYVK